MIELARNIGLGADAVRKMVIDPSRVVDADFIEITPEPLDPEEEARRDHANALRRERRSMSPKELEAHKAAQRQIKSERAIARLAEIQGRDDASHGQQTDDIFTVYPKEPTDDET